MKRIKTVPRPDWEARVESLDFTIHKDYWNEEAYYEFTTQEIDDLEAVANELHEMCKTILKDHWDEIIDLCKLPLAWKDYLQHTRNHFSLYGRFDFVYDAQGVIKLLEYNADTPTSLYEASVVQWHWLQDKYPQQDQFNSLHERLIDRWKTYHGSQVYFMCVEEHAEDFITTRYLMDTAVQAGLECVFIDIAQIGYREPYFVDEKENPIDTLFKLYPYEWMLNDEFGVHLTKDFMVMIEPPWKYLLSNKTILTLLWKYFPDHPNLLPTFLEHTPFTSDPKNFQRFVSKPMIGREGNNITIHKLTETIETQGPYAELEKVYQKFVDREAIDGYYPTLGVWMIGDHARGLGIREDTSLITGNTSKFTPHLFTEA